MIRFFKESDRSEVESLVKSGGHRKFPTGGLGIVSEEKGKIVGFVWALVSDSNMAMIDFFVVSEKKRGTGFTALTIMQKLMAELMVRGVTQVVGVVNEGQPGADSLIKYYNSAGMSVSGSYVIDGDPRGIIKWMNERRAA